MRQTFSERLFEEFCSTNRLPCTAVPRTDHPTPDYELIVRGSVVVCEVKQIDPNREDLEDLTIVQGGDATGRYVPNRVRRILRHVSPQLKAASVSGCPTLLAIYDNTPFKMYTMHADIVQAMFGQHSVAVRFTRRDGATTVSPPFFGGNRGLGPNYNTAVSAIGIIGGGPVSRPLTLRLYHNPYAAVRLEPTLFDSLPVTHAVLPDEITVSLDGPVS
jgi:hypothetical protein